MTVFNPCEEDEDGSGIFDRRGRERNSGLAAFSTASTADRPDPATSDAEAAGCNDVPNDFKATNSVSTDVASHNFFGSTRLSLDGDMFSPQGSVVPLPTASRFCCIASLAVDGINDPKKDFRLLQALLL